MNTITDSIRFLDTFIYQNILSFHFYVLSLCPINERLKNTFLHFTIIIDTVLTCLVSVLFLIHSNIVASCFRGGNRSFLYGKFFICSGDFLFIIMYPYTHTRRRIFSYFFYKPCYTHFISNIG